MTVKLNGQQMYAHAYGVFSNWIFDENPKSFRLFSYHRDNVVVVKGLILSLVVIKYQTSVVSQVTVQLLRTLRKIDV